MIKLSFGIRQAISQNRNTLYKCRLVKNFNGKGRLVMGYALYAMRKILLTDRVNNYNLELADISNKKNQLQQLGSAVADGEVSAMDLAQCQNIGLGMAYKVDMNGQLALSKTSKEYLAGRVMAENEANKQFGGSRVGNAVAGAALGGSLAAGAGALALAGKGLSIGTLSGGPLGAVIGGAIGLIGGAIVAHKTSAKSQAKDDYIKQYEEAYNEAQMANMVADLEKEIAEMENKLDKKQANLETKLTATQSELEAVQNAEGKAIQNSTPKYGGLQ